MRVAIDGTALASPGGVRRHLLSLLGELRFLAPEHDWLLYPVEKQEPSVRRFWREQVSWPLRLARDRADLVHFPKGNPPLRRLPCPAVVTVHDLLPLTHGSTETPAATVYWRIAFAGLLRNASQVVTVSDHSRRAFLAAFPFPEERVHAIPNGVDERFSQANGRRVETVRRRHGLAKPYLLTVGTLQPRKNHRALLAAFAGLVRRGYTGELAVAGRAGWRCGNLAAEAARRDLSGRVRWLGFVPEEDLPALYAGADLFLYPSLAEGFGFPPAEAAACGTPVVASRAGGLAEVLGEGALWVDPASPAEIRDAAWRLLCDRDLRERLSRQGRLRAGRFTWQEAARRTLSVYERALGSGALAHGTL